MCCDGNVGVRFLMGMFLWQLGYGFVSGGYGGMGMCSGVMYV